MKKNPLGVLFLYAAITFSLVVILSFYGDAGFINLNNSIFLELRIPKIVVAFLAGGLLASAGLLLQVYFQNPLAGPDLLGINAGASLGVALSLMGTSYIPAPFRELSQSLMALGGALSVFLILSFLIKKQISRITLLIIGLLISSFTSSFISVLINISPSLQVKNFMMWSMGSFQNVTIDRLPFFILFSFAGLLFLFGLPKKLNQLILGPNYATSMGVNVGLLKLSIVFICSYLVAMVTSYCGPVGFIGIIAPHIAKNYLQRSDMRFVLPAVFLVGSSLALFAELILILTSKYSLATNSILGLIGAPIIAFYLYRDKGRRIV